MDVSVHVDHPVPLTHPPNHTQMKLEPSFTTPTAVLSATLGNRKRKSQLLKAENTHSKKRIKKQENLDNPMNKTDDMALVPPHQVVLEPTGSL